MQTIWVLEMYEFILIWGKVFTNGPSKICGKQPLKNLKWYVLPPTCTLPPVTLAFKNNGAAEGRW